MMTTCVIGCPQVFLGPDGEVEVYDVVSIQPNAPISSDLLLDQAEENLFIMTSTMVHTGSRHIHCLFHMGSVLPVLMDQSCFPRFYMCFLINIMLSVFLYYFILYCYINISFFSSSSSYHSCRKGPWQSVGNI